MANWFTSESPGGEGGHVGADDTGKTVVLRNAG